MNENPNTSPESVDETLEYSRKSMKAVQHGLGWVMAGPLLLVLLILTEILMEILPTIHVVHLAYLIPMMLMWIIPLMQLWGMWKCLKCPKRLVPYSNMLIYAAGIFYLAAFACLWRMSSETIEHDKYIESAHEWLFPYVMLCFFLSAVLWQIFLLRLARGLNIRGLTIAASWMLVMCLTFAAWLASVVWRLSGMGHLDAFTMMFAYGWATVGASLTYAVLYFVVHIGLMVRMGKVMKESERFHE